MALTPKQEKFAQCVADGMTQADAYRTAFGHDSPAKGSGYYVYLLVDPRNDAIFYIGKGKGNRVSHHAKNAKSGIVQNAEKHKRICDIHNAGLQVKEVIFCNAEDELHALRVERDMIDLLSHTGLTNIMYGMMTNEELAAEEAKVLLKKLAPVSWILSKSHKDVVEKLEQMFGSIENYDACIRNLLNSIIDAVKPNKIEAYGNV